MSDKPEDKFIDELFKDSIDNVETEPSDHFWNKAYDSILKGENSAYTKKLWRLRSITLVLGLSVAGLIGYNAYTTIKLSDTVQKMAGLEKQQQASANNDLRKMDAATNAASLNNNSAVNASQPLAEQNVQHSTPNAVQSNKVQHNNAAMVAANINNVAVQRHNTPAGEERQFASSSNKNAFKHNTSVSLASNNTSSTQGTESAVANTSVQKSGNSMVYLEDRAPIIIPPQDKIDSIIFADVEDNAASVKAGNQKIDEQIAPLKKAPLKVSFSGYFAASYANPAITDNGSMAGISASTVKSREREQFAYTAGANIGYDVTNRLTVQLGVEYRDYTFSLAPAQVNVTTNELNSGYTYATSSGAISMPYIPAYTSQGYYDTIANARGSATRSYLSIPLHVKYYYFDRPKFGLYLTAGGSMNILVSNYAAVHCQNKWGEEDVYLSDVQGAKTFNFSGIFGLGATWKLKHGLSVFVEPSYSAAVTPNTTSNSPVTTYSNYFDLATGVSYHF